MSLHSKIENNSAVVGVIGLGYVGLPLMAAFHRAGFAVVGFDVDQAKINALHRGENYLKHLGKTLVSDMHQGAKFDATTDVMRMGECDVIISCVPTPLGSHREPDLSFVEKSAEDIAKTIRPGQLIVLESSTYPRTTREIMLPRFEARPEMRQGFLPRLFTRARRSGPEGFQHADDPETGWRNRCGQRRDRRGLYRKAIAQVIPVSSAEVAEAAKLLENIYRAVNIALVNEMKMVLDAMGIDVWEVIGAAINQALRFPGVLSRPRPGWALHSDRSVLSHLESPRSRPPDALYRTGRRDQPPDAGICRPKTALAMNDRGKAMKGSKILVLGLAYKPDVDDVRESPSFELIEHLEQLGAEVDYHDPHVPQTHKMRHHDLQMHSIELSAASLKSYDCVLIATHHAAYDWQMIADHSQLVVDTRNALRDVKGKREHIVKA